MDVAAGTRLTFIPDLQGSVIGTLDSATGTLSKIGYSVYGRTAAAGILRYTGRTFPPLSTAAVLNVERGEPLASISAVMP